MISSAASTGPAFTLRAVTQRKADRVILQDATLEVPSGVVTVLLGPSGAGKSSLLRLLNRLDDPAGGTVSFDGQPVTSYDVRALRRRVGFVFQTPVMFPGTVQDNLEVAADLAGMAPMQAAARLDSVLELVGLPRNAATRYGGELSVGQQQRATVARALIAGPEVLVLDEPTSATDPETAAHLLRTLKHLAHERAVTIVMATHRLDEAKRVADHVVVLVDGQVVECGAAAGIWASPQHDRTRRLLAASETPV